MNVEQLNEKLISSSMEMIMEAGRAQEYIAKALDSVVENDFLTTHELMEKAHQHIIAAHKIQTVFVQAEANDQQIRYSTLFTHAQDTLMTVKSEHTITSSIIKVYEAIERRIA